ncbi:MAG: hypothetical protein GX465_18085 [Acidobacteria bacterium]|nr:hypothetical protein [Acidobacteriota bacterium]
MAEEAIKANSGSKDGLPPVLNLGGGASIDAVDMISESIMSKIKMNTLNTALKMSEKLSNDAEAAVAPRSSVPGQVSSIPQPSVPLGILQPSPSSDRAAVVKAILESLESDESRLTYIREHPEMFSPSSPVALPTISPTGQLLAAPQQAPTSLVDSMNILMEAMKLGMSMQQAQQPQYSQSSPSSIDPIKILETFQAITEKTNSTFNSIVDQMRQQQVDQALKYQEIITNTQSKISEVNDKLVAAQVENANKDKEYLSERLSEAIAAANRPPSLQFDQVKGMIEAMRANDIPVQMGTSEDEKTKAQIEIEKARALHEIEMDRRRIELEEGREARRGEVLGTLASTVTSAIGAQRLKNRKLSSAASSVSSRL